MAESTVISMLILKLREVLLERVVLGRKLHDQLSGFVVQLEEVLYHSSNVLVDDVSDVHLQQQCNNVVICAREAEDISDTILVVSSMPPKFLKGPLFDHTVGDLIGYRDSRAKARKLIAKLMDLSLHYNMMRGRLSVADRGQNVDIPEYPMKPPTTTTTIVSNYEKLPIIGREEDAKKLGDKLKGTEQDAKKLGDMLKGTEQDAKKLGDKLQGTEQDAKKLGDMLEGTEQYAKKLGDMLEGTEQDAKKLGEQYAKKLGDILEGTEQDAKKLGDMLKGTEQYAKKLGDMLKGRETSLQLISVTGEEGIGKTALVRSVYDDPSIDNLFPCRAWISCSKGMSLRRMLVELIKQLPAKELKDLDHLELAELGWSLYMLLTISRYLIVLDNLKDCLPDVKLLLSYFPYYNRGSRVIMTSREDLFPAMGDNVPSLLKLGQLDEANSDKLLQKTRWMDAMGVTGKILSKCHGSPMKLFLFGGLLANCDARSRTVTKWLDLLKQDLTIQTIMSLSYQKLPHWVKPCLLYLCLFPREAEIPTRRVFQLWYSEGLARRNSPTTAEACLQELLNWNMVQLVAQREADRSPKTCCLQGYWHDYLSKLATGFGLLDIDGEDNHILRRSSPTVVSPWLVRCWGDDTSLPPQDVKTASCIRSYISFKTGNFWKRSKEVKLLLKHLEGMRDSALLRVLDLEGVYKPKLPDQFGYLLPNLRYLGLRWTILDSLPKSVMKLSKLETLDLKHTEVTKLPGSILSLKSLRHLYLNEVSFDSSIPTENFGSNMETLWGLSVGKGSRMVKALGKFKGLRKLGLTCYSTDAWKLTENISTLTMLESLRIQSRDLLGQPDKLELGPNMEGLLSLSKLYMLGRLDGSRASLGCLPRNLRVLTLSMSELQDDPMSSLGQLQHLVRLSLLGRSYVGKIITFPASSFPSLRELQLWKLEKLSEIRMEEGSMKSLEEMEIRGCTEARMIYGLENATKLKHVKLTGLTKQFARHLKTYRKEHPTQTWIITKKELVDGYEPFSPLGGYQGSMRQEVYDLFQGIRSPEDEEEEEEEEEEEPVKLPELDSIVDCSV